MKVWLQRMNFSNRAYEIWSENPESASSCDGLLGNLSIRAAKILGLPDLEYGQGMQYAIDGTLQDRLRQCERRNSELANENKKLKQQFQQDSKECDACFAELTDEKLRTELDAVKQGMDGMMQIVSLFKEDKGNER